MGKMSRLTKYFKAFALSVIAFIMGGRLNYELIKYLGGQYIIMTEFYSDWASNAFHSFSQFRNAALLLTILAVFLMIWLNKKSKKAAIPLFISLLLFTVGCVITSIIIFPPSQIAYFIIKRACYFAIYIVAVYIVLINKKR